MLMSQPLQGWGSSKEQTAKQLGSVGPGVCHQQAVATWMHLKVTSCAVYEHTISPAAPETGTL
jgi:hypothetical protein